MTDYITTQIQTKYPNLTRSINDKENLKYIQTFLSDNTQSSLFFYQTYSDVRGGQPKINFTNNINNIPNLGTTNFDNLALAFMKQDGKGAGEDKDKTSSNLSPATNKENIVCIPVSNESIKLAINNIYSPLYPELEGVFNGLANKLEESNTNKLMSLEDLTNLWYKKATSDIKLKTQADILKDITTVLVGTDTGDGSGLNPGFGPGFDDLISRIDICQDALNNLWSADFGEDNMLNLLSVIDYFIYNKVVTKLLDEEEAGSGENGHTTFVNTHNLYNYMSILPVLETLIAFLDSIQQLTTRFWLKNWKSGHYRSKYTQKLLNKLNQTLDVKMIEQQALLLLTEDDGKIFKNNNNLENLTKNVILSHDSRKFDKILKNFDKSIGPFLDEILAHIKEALDFNSRDITIGHIKLVQKWSAIISKYHERLSSSNNGMNNGARDFDLIQNILDGVKQNLKNTEKRFNSGFVR